MVSTQDSVPLLREAQQLCADDALLPLVRRAAELGAHDLTLYLLDYAQTTLNPSTPLLPGIPVTGTSAGACFATQRLLHEPLAHGDEQVWIPVTDRAQRLGVLSVRLEEPEPLGSSDEHLVLNDLGLLAAVLVLTAGAYCDRYTLQRRTRPMELAAEIQWSMLPPLSLECAGTALSGMLEPAYDVGGDTFDYAVDDFVVSLALFDAMGHGLSAAVLATLAVGAYRHARRSRATLAEIGARIDAAIAEQFEDCFVTALTAELDLRTGVLRWLSAGHPPPLLIRAGTGAPLGLPAAALPLGLGAAVPSTGGSGAADSAVRAGRSEEPAPGPFATQLEPGDTVLLFTDGVVESRSKGGEQFGQSQLADVVVRALGAGELRSEVLRRVVTEVRTWQGGDMRDDATLVMLEWSGPPD